MPIELTDRQRRLLDIILILAAIALAFVVAGFTVGVLAFFGDVLMLFFLAWLLAFAVLPLVGVLRRLAPRLPDAAAVMLVFVALVGGLLAVLIQASAAMAGSISDFLKDAPKLEAQLTSALTELSARLAAFGLNIDLARQAPKIVENLQAWAGQLVGPLQEIAVASIGVLGNILIVVIMAIYIALDRDKALSFIWRLVPPSQATTAHMVQTSVSRSFGGFLRTQLIMGLAFGLITAFVDLVFGLPYAAVTIGIAGVLHAIPFFGPFVSWAPPVLVALVLNPGATIPVVIAMAIGWFVTMNVLQPRLMAGAVGIHPIVVLGSVIVGSSIAGIAGAIFGIPIAAVLSAFFFHWFERSHEVGTVADRAAKRLETREGRAVRRPREPVGGVDEDLDEARLGAK
jgi:predicted PurR-regulated permease PerM